MPWWHNSNRGEIPGIKLCERPLCSPNTQHFLKKPASLKNIFDKGVKKIFNFIKSQHLSPHLFTVLWDKWDVLIKHCCSTWKRTVISRKRTCPTAWVMSWPICCFLGMPFLMVLERRTDRSTVTIQMDNWQTSSWKWTKEACNFKETTEYSLPMGKKIELSRKKLENWKTMSIIVNLTPSPNIETF